MSKYYYTMYQDISRLSEYDRKFVEERNLYMRHWGYQPPKRFWVEDSPPSTTQIQQWTIKDRQHLALWKLNRAKKEQQMKEWNETKRRREQLEYDSALINFEYERLERAFWAEAPKMLPYQKTEWFNGRWPEFYWKNTNLKKNSMTLENDQCLWHPLPAMPRASGGSYHHTYNPYK